MFSRAESLRSFCMWTAHPNILNTRWYKQNQLDVLFKPDADDDKVWELYIIKQPHAACMQINEHMKTAFEAWLSQCAKSKTPTTNPEYHNARGYSYTF